MTVLEINIDNKNYLEEMITNYIQLPTVGNAHIEYGITNITRYLNAKKGKVSEKYWRAYFDFLFFSKNKKKYETASELYSKVLKKSPPDWRNIKIKEESSRMPNVIKIMDLKSISKERIKDFIETIKESSYSRIDFSNTDFEKEDLVSITNIKELFANIKGEKCQILGQINFCNYLEQKIKQEDNKIYWNLLLDVYQCLGNKADYETLSMDYIDKFEESVLDYNQKNILVSIEDNEQDLGILKTSKNIELNEIINLTYFLEEHLNQDKYEIEIDFNNTQFISYSALEELSKFILNNMDEIKNKNVIFKNLNQITYTSMEVMGVDFNIVNHKMIKY